MPGSKTTSKESITSAAGAVGLATFLSRILGFVRDMIIAELFGARVAADAFFVAFRIPNLLRRLTAEGAMTAAFIPVFTDEKEKKGTTSAFTLACNVITILALFLAILTAAGELFAPQIVRAIAPGFTADDHSLKLTTLLTRIMFPYLLFISISAVLTGILNSFGRFFLPALTPALLNIAIITCALLFHDSFEEPTVALAIGVIIGGVFQMTLLIRPLAKLGFSFAPSFDLKDKQTRKIGLLLGPAALGMAVAEINIFVDTLLASLLPEGSISYLYYGNRVTQFPLGVFGVAVGIAALPAMSMEVVRNGKEKLVELVSHSLRLTLFISIPAMAGMIVLSGPIINVLFERGEFDEMARTGSVIALVYYSVGLFAFSAVKPLVSAFYAMKDTATPSRVAAWCMTLNVALNVLLMGPLLHGGLALATSISSAVNMAFLLWLLRKKTGTIDGARIVKSASLMVLSAAIMGTLVYMYSSFFFSFDAGALSRVFHLGAALFLGIVIYTAMTLLFRLPEAISVKNRIVGKIGAGS